MANRSLELKSPKRAEKLYELVKENVELETAIVLRNRIMSTYLAEGRATDAERLLGDVPEDAIHAPINEQMFRGTANIYLHNGQLEDTERIYRKLGDQKALATTVADAYRSVGDNDRAAMLFAEFSK